MARFYGTVQGGRGQASRLGHSTSGLDVAARSRSGRVNIRMYVEDGQDYCVIDVSDNDGWRAKRTLYRGPVAKLLTNGVVIQTMMTIGRDS